jgi:hypothetical protein
VLTDMNGERLASVDLSDKELKPGEPIKVSWTILMG